MGTLHFTLQDTTGMVVAAVCLLALSIWVQTFRKKQWDFMGHYKVFFAISGILLAVSVGALAFKGLNWGLDFSSGSVLTVSFDKTPDQDAVRQVVAAYKGSNEKQPLDLGDAVVQRQQQSGLATGGAQGLVDRFQIRVKELASEDQEGLKNLLKDKFGSFQKNAAGVEDVNSNTISPAVAKETAWNALWALLIALGLQLIYITFRFGSQIRYGVAADIAMVHDVLIMVGIYALVGRPVDSPFVAAILTVVGYSVMDSIVIFDRIRENLRNAKRESYQEVVNLSVNQTMTRSVNTLLTVLFTLFALYFFGGDTLKNFAFALLVGVTSGGYSSIFVASPVLILIDNWNKRREAAAVSARRTTLEADAARRAKERQDRGDRGRPGKQPKPSPLDEDYPSPEELPETTGTLVAAGSGRRRARGRRRRR